MKGTEEPTVSSVILTLIVALTSDDELLLTVVSLLGVNPQMALFLD